MKHSKWDTEDKIETEAERMQNQLDKEYMNSDMTKEEYKMRCEEIHCWVDLRYAEI